MGIEALPSFSRPLEHKANPLTHHTATHTGTPKHFGGLVPQRREGGKNTTPQSNTNKNGGGTQNSVLGLPPPRALAFLQLGDSSRSLSSVIAQYQHQQSCLHRVTSTSAFLPSPAHRSTAPSYLLPPQPQRSFMSQVLASPLRALLHLFRGGAPSRAGEIEGPFFCRLGEGLLVLRELPRDICLQRVVGVRLLQHLQNTWPTPWEAGRSFQFSKKKIITIAHVGWVT